MKNEKWVSITFFYIHILPNLFIFCVYTGSPSHLPFFLLQNLQKRRLLPMRSNCSNPRCFPLAQHEIEFVQNSLSLSLLFFFSLFHTGSSNPSSILSTANLAETSFASHWLNIRSNLFKTTMVLSLKLSHCSFKSFRIRFTATLFAN